MIERPILFSAPMVRAILEGRKTQTRRVVKAPPVGEFCGICTSSIHEKDEGGAGFADGERLTGIVRNRYGQPGDRLWVRETTEAFECGHALLSRYSADGADVVLHGCDDPAFDGSVDHWSYPRRSRPSIHMPRRASRISLELTGVRIERLQAITEADAKAEGCGAHPVGAARGWFHDLWDEINGPESWDANPWVWVVEFRRVKP